MARDGLVNILFALGVTLIPTLMIFFTDGAMAWRILAFAMGTFLLFTLYFFRDPERKIEANPELVLSPGDGTVVGITEVEDEFIGPAWRITLFLSPLNVHINRVPVDGTVSWVKYHYGSFKAAFAEDASEVNERNIVAIENERVKVVFSQVAGIAARRIISHLRQGDNVTQGQRYGLIKFGSRMDILLPRSCEVLVNLKEPVRGGLTALARISADG